MLSAVSSLIRTLPSIRPSSSLINQLHHLTSVNNPYLLMFREQQQVTMSTTINASKYEIIERGSLYSLDYRIYFRQADSKNYISPWHDIPLYADQPNNIYNMIVEIPRWTNAKMEQLNPIRQDEKRGMPRFVNNIFPHHGYIWNYGALPQTWEKPDHVDGDTGAHGDNDPIDVIEIGSKVQLRGSVVQVKILGVLALIDEGETDWKLVAIDVTDRLAESINDIDDVNKNFPGLLRASSEFFRNYKIPTGKPANKFGFDGQYKNRSYAHSVIAETHGFWKNLVSGASANNELNISSIVDNAIVRSNATDNAAIVDRAPAHGSNAEVPAEVDVWHYIKV